MLEKALVSAFIDSVQKTLEARIEPAFCSALYPRTWPLCHAKLQFWSSQKKWYEIYAAHMNQTSPSSITISRTPENRGMVVSGGHPHKPQRTCWVPPQSGPLQRHHVMPPTNYRVISISSICHSVGHTRAKPQFPRLLGGVQNDRHPPGNRQPTTPESRAFAMKHP